MYAEMGFTSDQFLQPVRMFEDRNGNVEPFKVGQKISAEWSPSKVKVNSEYENILSKGGVVFGEVYGEESTQSPVSILMHDLGHMIPIWNHPSLMKQILYFKSGIGNLSTRVKDFDYGFNGLVDRMKLSWRRMNETYISVYKDSRAVFLRGISSLPDPNGNFKVLVEAGTSLNKMENWVKGLSKTDLESLISYLNTHFYQLFFPSGGAASDIVSVHQSEIYRLGGWDSLLLELSRKKTLNAKDIVEIDSLKLSELLIRILDSEKMNVAELYFKVIEILNDSSMTTAEKVEQLTQIQFYK